MRVRSYGAGAGAALKLAIHALWLMCLCTVIKYGSSEEKKTNIVSEEQNRMTKSSKDDACEWEGVQGRCVPPERCISTNPYVKGLVHPPACTDQNVCCTDCANALGFDASKNASDLLLDGKGNIHWKNGQKSRDKCIEWHQRFKYWCTKQSWLKRELQQRPIVQNTCEHCIHFFGTNDANSSDHNDTKIQQCHSYSIIAISPVGGKDVVRGEFPHMILLGYELSSSPSEWVCGGSLISEWFVLTAGHCLSSISLGKVSEMAAGVLKRSDEEQFWQKRRVVRAIPYPEYRPPIKYHDIALLQADKRFELGGHVLPACLPVMLTENDFEDTYRKRTAIAAGWGATGTRQALTDNMLKVELEAWNVTRCSTLYKKHRHLPQGLNPETQLCYGYNAGDRIVDSCPGDSGGPLFRDTGKPSCAATLLGVTSFGHDCGQDMVATRAAAGVYTRVEYYMPWIEGIIWNDTYVTID